MGKTTGTEIKAAFRKTSAWGTPLACGVGHGLMITGMGIKKTQDADPDDSLGSGFVGDADMKEIKVAGDISAFLRYDGLDLLIAMVMGQTGGSPVQQGLTTAYAQTFTLLESIDGLFGCLALNNQVNIDEYRSLKVYGFTLKGDTGQAVEVTFHCIGDDLDLSSSVNTAVTFANVTFVETKNRVRFSHATFRMNDQMDAALDSADVINPSGFEFSCKRPVEGVYAAGSNADVIDEPSTNGQIEVSLKLTFPRYTTKQNFVDWSAGTLKKMDIAFVGALIEGAFYRQFRLQMPQLKIVSAELPIDGGILKHPLEFIAMEAGTAPAGMTGITEPVRVDVINKNTADVLA